MREPESNFSHSKGNNYSVVDRRQPFAQNRVMAAAKSLACLLRVVVYKTDSTRTLRILNKDYQATKIIFTNSFAETCTPEISVPLDFAGDVRIWTNNRQSKRVWSTIEKIKAAQCDPGILFKFIAQKFDAFTPDMDDDIPF